MIYISKFNVDSLELYTPRYLEPSIREKEFNCILEILILKRMKKFNGNNNYFSSLSKVICNCVLIDHIMYMYFIL